MNKDYIGCEIAARLTGHLENVILRHLTEGNYTEAKRRPLSSLAQRLHHPTGTHSTHHT
jgi:hypothetical protein